jgi:diacylglycerol kinase (ATP)
VSGGAGPDRGRPVEPGEAQEHVATSVALFVDGGVGRGRVGRELPAIEEQLRAKSISHRMFALDRSGDAAEVVRAAVADGERFLVAVGDDQTVNTVLNGLMHADRPVEPDVVLGVLAANSGCDAVRTFGLSQDPAVAIERLARGLVYPVDVGKATVSAGAGEQTRYFFNMAQIGLGGLAARRGAALPSFLGTGRRFWGYWLAMATYRRATFRLQGDRREFEGAATNVVVANLQFSGNGMHLSPRSWPEDGYLDLQVFTGPRSDSFTMLPKMFVGDHLPHPNILELRSTRVRIESNRRVFVEVDGRSVGTTPATLEVLQRALPFKV